MEEGLKQFDKLIRAEDYIGISTLICDIDEEEE